MNSWADELMGSEAAQPLQTAAEVVGADEVVEVARELCVAVVVIAPDRRVLDGPVHPLNLAIGPGMIDLREAVLDAVPGIKHLSRLVQPAPRMLPGLHWQRRAARGTPSVGLPAAVCLGSESNQPGDPRRFRSEAVLCSTC